MARLILTFKDFSSEMSTVEMLVPEVSAGGADYDALLTDTADLITAIEVVCTGFLAKQAISIVDNTHKGAAAAGSKRELGLRVFWYDVIADTQGHFTLPSPDPTGAWLVAGSDKINLAETDIAALIVEIEALVLSPDGNAVTVEKIVEVGRRN
jgi:hypothetical protein